MYKALLVALFAAMPSSTNFTLDAYDFGTGADSPTSSNYQLEASTGGVAGNASSSSYALPAGIRASTTIDTPAAPTFTNPENNYDRLKITLNVGSPADTKYLIAVSDDNFATTNYVQLDQTIGPSATIGNYQTYAAWGGASGFWVIGLSQATTYKVKVAALQGSATGSAFGPASTAATVEPSITFAVSTSATSTPPFGVGFSSLPAGAVTPADATIITDITTNALHGGAVLLKSQNAGLTSPLTAFTVVSATADLSSTAKGYGAQVTSTSQSAGGPLAATSPFNGASNSVGALTASWQQLADFGAPLTSGSVTTTLKAKADNAVPSATDYSDKLTISVSLLF